MEEIPALVIGAGPAGLMAAEVLGEAGLPVTVVDAKPSVGRKFLMAGKSGLNLTRSEDPAGFTARYTRGASRLAPMIAEFGPVEVRAWADALGAESFVGSSGRVFPSAMKASPLLRAWLARLSGLGVAIRTRWRWVGVEAGVFRFETSEGVRAIRPRVAVLALGGASWPRLGSDGAWTEILAEQGVALAPFRPSNVGFELAWSEHMVRHFGAPVKSVTLIAGDTRIAAEFVISRHGVEGGGIYALGHLLRDGVPFGLDLVPDRTLRDVAARLASPRGRLSLSNHLRRRLKLSPVKIALLRECAPPEVLADPHALAAALKALPLPLAGPRPMAEAISTAGGVRFEALDGDLMLKDLPGVFCAGEMLDWDAPTGGYLITGCLATGRWAGRAAARRLSPLG